VGNYAWFWVVQKDRGVRVTDQQKVVSSQMSRAYENDEALSSVIDAVRDGRDPDRTGLRDAVRALLALLSQAAPGRSVEVRVPPFGVVQCVDGPRHTRGTPPNVVEMDAVTWVKVATGLVSWDDANASGVIRSSGIRSDLSPYLPVITA
jgi:hypothetical protein